MDLGRVDPWVRAQRGGSCSSAGGLEDLSRGCAVSDRCGLVESEHDGQMERVGAVGERFVELTVDAQGFQGGGSAAEWRGERVVADGSDGRGGLFVDDQVRVGVLGQRLRRYSSQSISSRWVSLSSERVTEPMVSRQLPRSTSSTRSVRMASGRAA